jgi:hypothetical protein
MEVFMGTFAKVAIGGLLVSVGVISALSSLGASLEEEFEAQALAEGPQAGFAAAGEPVAGIEDASTTSTGQASAVDAQIAGCKVALALMNDREVALFSGHRLDRDTVHVTWRSPDDGRLWEARCEKAGENGLRWAAYNAFGDGQQGRWRDEDTITTTVDGARIEVRLTQPGVGEKRASLDLNELG